MPLVGFCWVKICWFLATEWTVEPPCINLQHSSFASSSSSSRSCRRAAAVACCGAAAFLYFCKSAMHESLGKAPSTKTGEFSNKFKRPLTPSRPRIGPIFLERDKIELLGEKILAKNSARGEKITNIRYASALSFLSTLDLRTLLSVAKLTLLKYKLLVHLLYL